MLGQYILPIIVALIVFPGVALFLLIPFAYRSYRRYKRLTVWQALVFFTFMYYLLALLFYIVLPLPAITSNFCTVHHAATIPQLRPFQFIADIVRENSALSLQDVLISRAFLQVVFNILLFVPLGVYLRYYFALHILIAVLIAFATSLFLELSQLTGLWHLYPCAYRLFDVDDLMLNTSGALLGYSLAVALPFLPPPRPGKATTPPTVSITRRLLAWLIDGVVVYFGAFLAYVGIFGILYVYNGIAFLRASGTLIFSLCVFVVALANFMLVPLMWRGTTIGKHVVALTLITTARTVPNVKHILLRYAVFVFPITALSLLQAMLAVSGLLRSAPFLWLVQWSFVLLYIVPIFLRSDHQSLGGLVSHTSNIEQAE